MIGGFNSILLKAAVDVTGAELVVLVNQVVLELLPTLYLEMYKSDTLHTHTHPQQPKSKLI